MAILDPFFDKVVSLLHFDAPGFIDATGKIWTPSGSPTIDTSVKKFGISSASFHNNTGISTPASPDFLFGTGDFTIEAQIFPSGANNGYILGFGDSSDYSNSWYLESNYTGSLSFLNKNSNTANPSLTSAASVAPAGTFTHVAVTRLSNLFTIWANGIAVASGSFSGAMANNKLFRLWVGAADNNLYTAFNGHIDEVRVTKGLARYTSSFTPPTAAFMDGAASISGNVTYGATPETRSIKFIDPVANKFVGSAISDPSTGDYSIDLSTVSPVYGIAYIDYGQPWEASTAYALNARTWPYAAPNGHWYLCTQAGTSGSAEPTWPTSGGTVTDGTAIWTDQGLMERPWIEGPYLPS